MSLSLFGRGRQLANEGVLGLNKRNGDYILRFNSRSRYPLVDDKLLRQVSRYRRSTALSAHSAKSACYRISFATTRSSC